MNIKEEIASFIGVDVEDLNEVEEVRFTSEWVDEGDIESTALFNTETGLVFDIEQIDPDDIEQDCDMLNEEYITLTRLGESLSLIEDNGDYFVKTESILNRINLELEESCEASSNQEPSI